MSLRQDVVDAFSALGLTPDVDIQEATKAYRRLAFQHHPDRNHGDASATQRFQQISHSWDICQRYYENPNGLEGRYDDDMDLDGEDLFQFYMFMFTETLYNRFNRSSRKQYKNQHFGHRAGPILFSFEPPSPEFCRPSFSDDSQDRQDRNAARQQKEREEYERRKRELELEVEREEREAKDRAMKQKADVDRLLGAQERAFQAAHAGNSEEVVRLINEYTLDVNAPRNLKTARGKKQDENHQYETLLHAAACQCDENLFTFLIEKGANPGMLDKQSLNPFHAAIKAGNSQLVRFILERRGGKVFQDYHPSKATPSGSTPLQLAIESNASVTIELLVKHATTHDVERCWKQMDLTEDIKEILRTKKGFVPPGEGLEGGQSRGKSKKAHRQQEQAQEKEARIAEELRRAEINRQKKEERTAKRAALEQEKAAREEEQLKKAAEEEAEQQRQEEIRRAEAEVRARELDEAKIREVRRAEAEAHARKLEEETLRAKAEEEARARRLEEERSRVEAEAKKLKEEQEARERANAKVRDRAPAAGRSSVQTESLKMRHIEQDPILKAREELEVQQLEQEIREKDAREGQTADVEKQEERTRHRSSERAIAPPDTADGHARAIPNGKQFGRSALTDEQRRELRREKQKERRKVKQKVSMTDAIPQRPDASTSSVPQPKASGKKVKPPVDVEQMDERQRNRYEQAMKRRAEQSARDKERHRKMIEERKRAQVESPTQSEQSEYVPLTPVSTDAPRPERVRSTILEPTLLSLNGTPPYMEDIQTCIVPDDLFREVRPPSYPPVIGRKADPVEYAESPSARKSHRRFYRQHRPRHGAQSGA